MKILIYQFQIQDIYNSIDKDMDLRDLLRYESAYFFINNKVNPLIWMSDELTFYSLEFANTFSYLKQSE